MDILLIVSIVLEVVIAIMALVLAVRGRAYMIGFTLTFSIYVYYDLARLYQWSLISESLLSVLFLIATLAALASMIGIFKASTKK